MPNQLKGIPKVAIITRTKSRPLFLERAIQSVDSQVYQNYVHVILNDGGETSEVNKLLDKYKNKNRVVIHNQKSLGHVKALNQAIRAVDSEYITILDDDDTWAPERLEKTISYLDKTGEKAVVVKMDLVIEEIQGNKIDKISQTIYPESTEGEISLYKQCYKNYVSNGIVTYRREVYNELKGYDESLQVAEDWDFGIRLLMKYDVAFLRSEKPLFFYHQRPTQKGIQGNSVHAEVFQQEKTINVIRNRYLRNDMISGRFGVGYIMNNLNYQHQTIIPENIKNDEKQTVRLEGHVNYVSKNLRAQINEDIENKLLRGMIKKLVKKRSQKP